ncbi:MAG: hypothetical protein WA728_12610, partial [Xanthobacteraceae bacterium]
RTASHEWHFKLSAGTRGRTFVQFTATFDLNRNLIYAIAAKVYRRGRRGSYEAGWPIFDL